LLLTTAQEEWLTIQRMLADVTLKVCSTDWSGGLWLVRSTSSTWMTERY